MLSAEISNMRANPDDYFGKIVKVGGSYSAAFYEETGLYYHYVITLEGDNCCREGLEFIWNGDHSYPDDYPEEQAKIEVIGVFGSYDELGRTYYYLSIDNLAGK